ncbi:MAG: DUF3144 domain-containing protein [Methylotenera sp.]|nr:DUF3144 domain-containing protein [Methylotenera sp.]
MADSNQVEATPDDTFWQLTDNFIAHANQLASANDVGVVNASFIFASARFNTYIIASQCGTKEAFETEKTAALDYFVNQYKIALTEHMAEVQKNFDQYISPKA